MAHALPPQPGRRRNRSIGAVVVIVVIAALAVAGLILKNRLDGRSTAASTSSQGPITTATSVGSPTLITTTTPPATTTPTTTPPATTTPTTTTPTTTTPAPTTTPPTPTVPLIVANNTDRAGLAADAEARFEAAGWDVTKVSNFAGDVLSTCAFYDPSDPKNLAAAKSLQAEFPFIKRIKPRFSRLPVGPIVVVLTSDYH